MVFMLNFNKKLKNFIKNHKIKRNNFFFKTIF